MDTPLDFPVHYLQEITERDANDQVVFVTRPWCQSPERGIMTKNQARVDCTKCIRWAGIKSKQP